MKTMRWTPEGVGEKIVDIALSISLESIRCYDTKTVLASYSDVSASLKKLEQIHQAIEEVQQSIADIQGHEGEYLRGILRAHACTLRVLQGDQIPYEKRLLDMQQLILRPIPEAFMAQLEQSIDCSLRKKGYKGTVAQKIMSYCNDTAIIKQKVTSTAQEIVSKMREETLKKVVPLPDDEQLTEIGGITGVFWSGFSKYDGNNKGTVTFNLDRPWCLPTFANILSHEAYPGHQTFYCLWDHLYLSGKLPIEASMYAYNTPTNSLFEGCPENGLDFLGWLSEQETPWLDANLREEYRLGRQILDYQRMFQTQACYLHHIQSASTDEATAYLMRAGVFQEIEAKNTVRFFTHPIQCTYYPSYYYGRHLIAQAFKQYSLAQRHELFDLLYATPQTNDTLIAAVSKHTNAEFLPFESV